MHKWRFISNIIIQHFVISGRRPDLLPVRTPVQRIDPRVIPFIPRDQSVLFVFNCVYVDMVIVGANSQVTFIRGVLDHFAVVLSVLQTLYFLVKIIKTSYAHFPCVAADNQVVMFH